MSRLRHLKRIGACVVRYAATFDVVERNGQIEYGRFIELIFDVKCEFVGACAY